MFNSPIRVDLGVMPKVDNPDAFGELLVLYRAIRQLHIEASGNIQAPPESPEEVATNSLLDHYGVTEKSRIVAVAETDILARQPLVCRYLADQLLVRTITAMSTDLFLGFAQADATAGALVAVYVEPAVVTGFSGLTAGERCYMTAAKQITHDYALSVNAQVIGFALSSTSIQTKSLYGSDL